MSRAGVTQVTESSDDDEDLLTAPEAAAYLRVGVDWVRRQCSAGEIPARKLGRDWRVKRGALRTYAAGTGSATPAQGGRKKTARQKKRDTT